MALLSSNALSYSGISFSFLGFVRILSGGTNEDMLAESESDVSAIAVVEAKNNN